VCTGRTAIGVQPWAAPPGEVGRTVPLLQHPSGCLVGHFCCCSDPQWRPDGSTFLGTDGRGMPEASPPPMSRISVIAGRRRGSISGASSGMAGQGPPPCLRAAVNGTFVGTSLRAMTIWPTSSSSRHRNTHRASHGRTGLVAWPASSPRPDAGRDHRPSGRDRKRKRGALRRARQRNTAGEATQPTRCSVR